MNGDAERRPDGPPEPPDGAKESAQPCDETRDTVIDPACAEVEPSGETVVEGIARECAETKVDDIPEPPPTPPKPPDEPTQRRDEPPSVELEGERRSQSSCDEIRTDDDADATAVPRRHEDAREYPKELPNTPERVIEHPEQRMRADSQGTARGELGDPRNKPKKLENPSQNAQNKEKGRTHLGGTQTTQTTRAAKRPYQATYPATRDALGAMTATATAARTRHVELEDQEVRWRPRRCREASETIGTAATLQTAPDTMGHAPAARGTSAPPKQTRYVEVPGQETIRASWSCWEASRAIGGAGSMANEPDTMGDEVRRMAQQAAHTTTRNESERSC